jgi:hypothetical protein
MPTLTPINQSSAYSRWNNFIASQPFPPPFSFNPSLFSFYQKHFHWKPYYFLLYTEDQLTGLLPLVNTGKKWVSLPHFSYGGVLVDKDFRFQESGSLIHSAIDFILQKKLSPGFYRFQREKESYHNNHKLFIRSLGNQHDEHFIRSEKIIRLMDLPESEESMFDKLNANLRRKIRKGDKNKLTLKTGGLALLDDFYSVYSKNICFLKSLSYGKKFFDDLLRTYQYGEILLFVAYIDNISVGSAMLLSYGNFYENVFFATLPEKRKYYVSDWLHWQMVKYVMAKDHQSTTAGPQQMVYSFGRSTRFSSVHAYKSHWPAKDVPLFVYSNIHSLRKYNWILHLWGVVPCFITKPVGAKLIKHIY